MRWAALYRRPPILRGISASQIRADHAANQAWIIARFPECARSQHESELTKGSSNVHRLSISTRNCSRITRNDVTGRHKLGGPHGTACRVRNANGLYGVQ